jgi:hypothetical protein
MASDSGQRERGSGAVVWRLPKIIAVHIARVRYRQPQYHVIQHKMTPVETAVEVVIQTTEPIPERALSPALFIGEEILIESEPAGHLRYRFYAFEEARLKEGAPIALGWTMSNSPKVESDFRYQVEGEETR